MGADHEPAADRGVHADAVLRLDLGVAALVQRIVRKQLLGRRQAEVGADLAAHIQAHRQVVLAADVPDHRRLADVRGVVAHAGGQVEVGDEVRRQVQLGESRLGHLVLLGDHQDLVAAAVLLQVVAEIGLDARLQRPLAERVQPVIAIAPEGVLIEHI